MIIESSLIDETTSFRDTSCKINKSVICRNVVMGSNVQIERSIIMDKVTIGDNVSIVGCFVGPRAQISTDQVLRDVEIATAQVVGDKSSNAAIETSEESTGLGAKVRKHSQLLTQ